MPVEFNGLLTVEHFHALSGFAGVCAAFVIHMFWSRGL